MSLVLHESHRAWQQRVSKEILIASRSFQLSNHSTPSNSSKIRSLSQLKAILARPKSAAPKKPFKPKHNSSNKRKFPLNLQVYAEVRGKYARPAPQMNKVIEKNPLLRRPVTAGSMRPKSANCKIYEKSFDMNFDPLLEYLEKTSKNESFLVNGLEASGFPVMKKEENVENGVEIVQKEENKEENKKISESLLERESNKKGIEKDKQCVEKVGSRMKKRVESKKEDRVRFGRRKEKINEAEKKIEKNRNHLEGSLYSKSVDEGHSKISSAATRKYVEELETLLREEQLKRIRLEELLEKVS